MSTIHFTSYARYEASKNINQCECFATKRFIDEATLEKIAHQRLTGGFDIRKKNRCSTCNTFKSKNGECLC
jgi:hypothetical protein